MILDTATGEMVSKEDAILSIIENEHNKLKDYESYQDSYAKVTKEVRENIDKYLKKYEYTK